MRFANHVISAVQLNSEYRRCENTIRDSPKDFHRPHGYEPCGLRLDVLGEIGSPDVTRLAKFASRVM